MYWRIDEEGRVVEGNDEEMFSEIMALLPIAVDETVVIGILLRMRIEDKLSPNAVTTI